ncbi:MAG: aromatic ring-hydroxylating dioxygenase subunit alpha [Halioglobus sp.]
MDPATTAYLKAQIDLEFQRFKDKGSPPKDFAPLADIPAGRYIDDEFYELEKEHIWSKSWLLAAHADELPDVGSYRLWESSGTPILIVRGRDNQIRAFYNTCTHRGGPLVRQEAGKEKVFVCKYHCWAFSLDGALNHIPDEHEFIAIDKSERGLIPVRCELFGNWIYINRDSEAMPLTEFLGPLVSELKDFEPDQLKLVTRYHFDLNCNWKITMDAFQEVYHLKNIHPDTVYANLDHRGASMALFPQGSSRMMVPAKTGRETFTSIPAASMLDEGDQHEMVRSGSLSYNMFPNIVTPISASEFPYLQFWPTSKSTTRFEVTFFGRGDDVDKDSAYWQEKVAGFNVVLNEDNENLPWIQRSIESGALKGVPLSYQERRIYHFHEYVDQVIGIENIPEHLRVVPKLQPLQEDGKGQKLK